MRKKYICKQCVGKCFITIANPPCNPNRCPIGDDIIACNFEIIRTNKNNKNVKQLPLFGYNNTKDK